MPNSQSAWNQNMDRDGKVKPNFLIFVTLTCELKGRVRFSRLLALGKDLDKEVAFRISVWKAFFYYEKSDSSRHKEDEGRR